MEAFAQLDSTVLITGARGSGKTSVAQWIHNNGPRASRPLAYELLRRSSRRRGCPPPALTNDAVTALQQYAWPGNVRELDDVLQRAAAAGGGSFEAPTCR